ncbi:MAG: ZIP family metal transporter [Methylotenera sp.]|nr:ZIP family metal transporter [Methylotenera sp.]
MNNLDQINSPLSAQGWVALFKGSFKEHRIIACGLVLALISLAVLWSDGFRSLFQVSLSDAAKWALLAGLAGFVATTVGALPVVAIKKLPQRIEDSMLGFAAGMMLAASVFSLIMPALDAGQEMFSSRTTAALVVVIGLSLGVMLMLGLDQFTPHEHDKTGPCGPGHERCGKVWLFVFAIALHNLPEGMAMGVSFSNGDMSVGLPLSTAIAIQDIPEGLAVALSLSAVGIRPFYAIGVTALTGLLEPLGALLGFGLSSGTIWTYPVGLGLAAGAMLFVVSHEVIPETHRNGHQTTATVGLMVGFALMMVLDTTLG